MRDGIGKPYEIRDGTIRVDHCEVNLTSHCNLSCRSCSHLSPIADKAYADPDVVRRDLTTLARYYRVAAVSLLGGEPLLHPGILDVIAAVRASGIADRVRVVTNGVLLWRVPDAFWERVDEVRISVYPGKEPPPDRMTEYGRKAKTHDVALKVVPFDRFRVSYSEQGTTDVSLVRRIYRTCKMAHVWRCHTVQSGYFYKCSQSPFIPELVGAERGLVPATLDGIKIVDSPTFGQELLRYLEAEDPLASCSYCLGTVGKAFPHTQLPRAAWREPQQYPTEELISMEYLRRLEDNPDAPGHWRTPPPIARSPGLSARLRKRIAD